MCSQVRDAAGQVHLGVLLDLLDLAGADERGAADRHILREATTMT